MNQKKLTIAIPTYNRASLLEEQVNRIHEAIKGFEDYCEILISNNCSTDNTESVLKKIEERSEFIDLNIFSQPENIGALRNICHCIKVAKGKHVWVVSDDDELGQDSIRKVVASILKYPDLGLLVLNFSTKQPESDEIIKDSEYLLGEDDFYTNGKDFFEKYLKESWGGLVLTTALVYKTDLARSAIENWFSSIENSMFQLYITAFCAKGGSALMTKDSFLTWVTRKNFIFSDKKIFIQHHFVDVPTVFLKFVEMGYSKALCREMMFDRFLSLGGLSCSLRLLAKRPIFTSKFLVPNASIMYRLVITKSAPNLCKDEYVS